MWKSVEQPKSARNDSHMQAKQTDNINKYSSEQSLLLRTNNTGKPHFSCVMDESLVLIHDTFSNLSRYIWSVLKLVIPCYDVLLHKNSDCSPVMMYYYTKIVIVLLL